MRKITRARLIRLRRGISQHAAGIATGTSLRTIFRLETGVLNLDGASRGMIRRIEEFYGEPVDVLIQEVAA
jgi:transcriptional regulator with XRE-family HTH domain